MPNNYTGTTTINAGTVSITTPAALGTNTIDFAGNGTLQWNGITSDLSAQMKIENAASATVDTMANNVAFATPFALGGAGGGALVKTGSGGLTFNTINAYAGGTTINGGYISITNNLSLGAAVRAADHFQCRDAQDWFLRRHHDAPRDAGVGRRGVSSEPEPKTDFEWLCHRCRRPDGHLGCLLGDFGLRDQ